MKHGGNPQPARANPTKQGRLTLDPSYPDKRIGVFQGSGTVQRAHGGDGAAVISHSRLGVSVIPADPDESVARTVDA